MSCIMMKAAPAISAMTSRPAGRRQQAKSRLLMIWARLVTPSCGSKAIDALSGECHFRPVVDIYTRRRHHKYISSAVVLTGQTTYQLIVNVGKRYNIAAVSIANSCSMPRWKFCRNALRAAYQESGRRQQSRGFTYMKRSVMIAIMNHRTFPERFQPMVKKI